MSDRSQPSDPAALSAEAAAEWIRHVESVLRGIAHALNNRAAALAALVELTSDPPEQPAMLREILDTEQQRVRDLVQAVRSIAVPRGGPEALQPADIAVDVGAVLALHADLRDSGVQIDATQASPIRAPRWAFARALIGLAAGVPGADRTTPRRVAIGTEGDWVIVTVDDPGRVTSTLVIELTRLMGGEPLADRYGIRMPTLAALRRREGR